MLAAPATASCSKPPSRSPTRDRSPCNPRSTWSNTGISGSRPGSRATRRVGVHPKTVGTNRRLAEAGTPTRGHVTVKSLSLLLAALALLIQARTQAQEIKRDIPYASPALERQVLDVYSPPRAKNLPV